VEVHQFIGVSTIRSLVVLLAAQIKQSYSEELEAGQIAAIVFQFLGGVIGYSMTD